MISPWCGLRGSGALLAEEAAPGRGREVHRGVHHDVPDRLQAGGELLRGVPGLEDREVARRDDRRRAEHAWR